jgi:hypothetical protein
MTHEQAVETMAAERYLLDEMSEIERYRFEEHFFECDECAESMRLGHQLRTDAGDLFSAGVRAPAAAPTVAARASGWSRRTVLPWAAAAVLAIALVGQVRQSPPTADNEVASAHVPVVLRPASRGQLPHVAAPERGRVALTLDVNIGTPGSPIAYRLAPDGGPDVAAGDAIVPPAGVPLVLVVDADTLRPEGTFVLTLKAAGAEGPPAEYRFTTAPR